MSQRAQPKPLSLAFRVALFFSRRPDEELDIADISVKFDHKMSTVQGSLLPYVRSGVLDCRSNGRGRGKLLSYRPGPRLLELMGGGDNSESGERTKAPVQTIRQPLQELTGCED